ncbi:MAG: hypothetical protein IT429_08645 [Gemmataceae bacterium]|nr:hypothetical protein [Gemmataceae bacterium]
MKRRNLFFVTILSLAFSGICMAQAGWFTAERAPRPAPRAAQARSTARTADPMTSQAAWRYRRGQASNWRTVMMYR